MEIFNVKLAVAATTPAVISAYWSLQNWPEIAPHVCEITMHYADEAIQVLTMTVKTKGKTDAFKSVRIRQANAIHFFQPCPPLFLSHHTGCWQFNSQGNATVVTVEHAIEVNIPAARAFLGMNTSAINDSNTVCNSIREIISNNSLQTMTAIKVRLEKAEEHRYALAN